ATGKGVGVSWPSVPDLAARTGLTPRGVEKVLRRLESRNLVVTERRPGRTSRYRPTPERGFGDPRTAVHPNPQEPRDSTVGEGIRLETYGSGRSGGRRGARKLAARRRRR